MAKYRRLGSVAKCAGQSHLFFFFFFFFFFFLLGEPPPAAELMAREIPRAVGRAGMVPEGVALLAGKPKLGKSWLALGLCVAVASGGVAFGNVRVEKGSALYLALEDNERRLQFVSRRSLPGPRYPTGCTTPSSARAWTREGSRP